MLLINNLQGIEHVKTPHQLDSQGLAMSISAVSKSTSNSRNISSPGSPVETHLQHPRSPQHVKGKLPSSTKSTSRGWIRWCLSISSSQSIYVAARSKMPHQSSWQWPSLLGSQHSPSCASVVSCFQGTRIKYPICPRKAVRKVARCRC